MPPISENEAAEFERLANMGHKLLERGRSLAGKDQLTDDEKRELSQINETLRQIDDWFNRTAK